jgi:choline dehydrogenase
MFPESGDTFNFFLPPYVVFGRGARATIPGYAKRLGLSRVLLVLDPFFVETADCAALHKGLEDSNIEATAWSGVVPNPEDVGVDEATRLYRENGCEGVICIGGGSAMDTGKSVGVMIASGAEQIREHMPPASRPLNGMAPVICAPTTAGTGAEVNPYSMVVDTVTGQKKIGYLAHELLSAQKVAVVDPDLTMSMSPRLTAVTGLDAFCHAVECYLTKKPNPISDDLAFRAISLVADNLRRAVYNGQDVKARVNMSLAATLATAAFPNAGLLYPHGLSGLGDKYPVPHGVQVGSVLVAALEAVLPFRTERLARVAEAFGIPRRGRSPREAAKAAIEAIHQLLVDIDFPTLSQATGATLENIEQVLDAMTAGKLSNWPLADQERIRAIAKRSLEL